MSPPSIIIRLTLILLILIVGLVSRMLINGRFFVNFLPVALHINWLTDENRRTDLVNYGKLRRQNKFARDYMSMFGYTLLTKTIMKKSSL